MNVRLTTQHVEVPPSSGEALTERVRQTLARLGDRIRGVQMTLKDINGPRGGRDKVCLLRAELTDGRQIVVVDRSDRMRDAISSCLRRTKALVAKQVKRRGSRHRRLSLRREAALS